jgi:hypothetical protein
LRSSRFRRDETTKYCEQRGQKAGVFHDAPSIDPVRKSDRQAGRLSIGLVKQVGPPPPFKLISRPE